MSMSRLCVIEGRVRVDQPGGAIEVPAREIVAIAMGAGDPGDLVVVDGVEVDPQIAALAEGAARAFATDLGCARLLLGISGDVS